jgi:hypothetical protein
MSKTSRIVDRLSRCTVGDHLQPELCSEIDIIIIITHKGCQGGVAWVWVNGIKYISHDTCDKNGDV